MTSKEIAIKIIQDLPDSVTWADIEERIRFVAAIDRGLADIKSGKIVPHKEVKSAWGCLTAEMAFQIVWS